MIWHMASWKLIPRIWTKKSMALPARSRSGQRHVVPQAGTVELGEDELLDRLGTHERRQGHLHSKTAINAVNCWSLGSPMPSPHERTKAGAIPIFPAKW